MPTVLASFSISFTGEKSCKTDIKNEITVSEHVYKVILPRRENFLFTWICNNQVMSTQSAFILKFREEWEATGRAERLWRPWTGQQTGRGRRWLQWEYLNHRQGKQEWQQHEESERGCFCWSGKDAKWLKAVNLVHEQEQPRVRLLMQEMLAKHRTCVHWCEDGECRSALWVPSA